MERHLYSWTVVSVSKHYKNPTKQDGLVKSTHHDYLISSKCHFFSSWYNFEKNSLSVKQQSITHSLRFLSCWFVCHVSYKNYDIVQYWQQKNNKHCILYKLSFINVILYIYRWLRLRLNMMFIVSGILEPMVDVIPLGIMTALSLNYFFDINVYYFFICHLCYWIISDYLLLRRVQVWSLFSVLSEFSKLVKCS